MFIGALFIITSNWSLAKGLFTVAWINEIRYIHTKKIYTAMKINKYATILLWTKLCPLPSNSQVEPLTLSVTLFGDTAFKG